MKLLINENLDFLKEKFIICKNNWKYSIDIKVNIALISISDIKYKKELLFILKSYILDQTSMLKSIYLISIQNDDNIDIFFKINIKKIKKINIHDFEFWIEDLLEEEKHYLNNSEYIGFRLVFNNESISWKEGRIYPNFNIINKIL